MNDLLGIGIVGYGKVASGTHLKWIDERQDCRLTAVCDTTEVRRAAAERDAPGVRTYEEFDRFLKDPEVDLVIVTTPPNSHCELSVLACRNGKHVFVDKPFAMSLREAELMLSAASSAGVVIHCHQSRRYDGEYQSILDVVASGRIGQIVHVRRVWPQYGDTWANWGIEGWNPSWRIQRSYGGGMVYDYAPHCGDQILKLIPSPLEQVFADVRRIKFSAEVDDHFTCALRFRNGATGYLEASNLARLDAPHWYVAGTKGCITALEVNGSIQVAADDLSEPAVVPPVHRRGELYGNLIAACRGDAEPLVTAADLRASMGLIDAIFESGQTHAAVNL